MCQGQSYNVNYPVEQKQSADITTESLERPNGDDYLKDQRIRKYEHS